MIRWTCGSHAPSFNRATGRTTGTGRLAAIESSAASSFEPSELSRPNLSQLDVTDGFPSR